MSRNWDTARIGVTIYYPSTGGFSDPVLVPHTCELPNRVTLKDTQEYKTLSSITRWNYGVAEMPPKYNFTMAFPVNSPTVRLLRALKVTGLPFNIELEDANNSSVTSTTLADAQFALVTEALLECRLTDRTLDIVVGDIPMVVFTGMALRYTFSDGNNISGDGTTSDPASRFGSGAPITKELFAEWQAST